MESSIAKQGKPQSFTTEQLGSARPQAEQLQADSHAGVFAQAASAEAAAINGQSGCSAGARTSLCFQVGKSLCAIASCVLIDSSGTECCLATL